MTKFHSNFLLLITLALVIFSSRLRVAGDVRDALPVTDVCLGCICEASSGCDTSLRCSGDVCGLFRITHPYWSDGGKQTLNGEAKDSPTAYANCANDPICAARTIQGYMAKYSQDCNNDGVVDCYDYAAIHKFGGFGCKGQLPAFYENPFKKCIEYALAQNVNQN